MKILKWYYHGIMFLFYGKLFDIALVYSDNYESSQYLWDKATQHEAKYMENFPRD